MYTFGEGGIVIEVLNTFFYPTGLMHSILQQKTILLLYKHSGSHKKILLRAEVGEGQTCFNV